MMTAAGMMSLIGKGKAWHARFGMTLVELLVVLGVIALIVGMSVPALSQYTARTRLKTAVRQLVGVISLARSLSVGSQEGHAVVIDTQKGRASITNLATGETLEDHQLQLPSSVHLALKVAGQEAKNPQIAFRPNGSLNGRTAEIAVSESDKQMVITVTGSTGAISVQ